MGSALHMQVVLDYTLKLGKQLSWCFLLQVPTFSDCPDFSQSRTVNLDVEEERGPFLPKLLLVRVFFYHLNREHSRFG